MIKLSQPKTQGKLKSVTILLFLDFLYCFNTKELSLLAIHYEACCIWVNLNHHQDLFYKVQACKHTKSV